MNALTKWNPFRRSSQLEELGLSGRWAPFREMENMLRDMDLLFNGGLSRLPRSEESMTIAEWYPSVDITEDEREFVVKTELPGVKKEDLKLTIQDDVLTIRGERQAEKKEMKYHRIERSYGSFERSFTLPAAVDTSKINSEFKEGVLTVHLPKNPNAKAKAIQIEVQ